MERRYRQRVHTWKLTIFQLSLVRRTLTILYLRKFPSLETQHNPMRVSIVALGRSSWKGPFVVPLPIAQAKKNGTPIRTNARSCTILPQFVGLKFQIHNGRDYVQVEISEDMVGSKLGEFAHTRKRWSYTQTKNKWWIHTRSNLCLPVNIYIIMLPT